MNPCSCHKTKVRPPEEMKALTSRLARIEGQVRGLRSMVENHAYCPDILTQASAVRAALAAFSRLLLESHIQTCVTEDIRSGKEEATAELMDVLRKMM